MTPQMALMGPPTLPVGFFAGRAELRRIRRILRCPVETERAKHNCEAAKAEAMCAQEAGPLRVSHVREVARSSQRH
jgi:hypothetical protein